MVVDAEDALVAQHLGMCQRTADILLPEALVEENAGGVALDEIAHRL